MTQDVQPLTWQKRTNIEEHMQFFSKINEIIVNLAPTVDEAEAAIAQATAAIASANDAIATANAASAAASAAASQAQTAASTVAGYDSRLTAAEGDIDALQAADQTITGNITALGTRMTAAESKNSQQDTAIAALQAADQTITGNITALGTRMTAAESKNSQQDTAIAALQTANAQNVKISRINEYAVGLTGNQPNINGIKKFINGVNAILMNRTTDNNGDGTTGRYKVIMKLPLNVSYGPRQHILFGVTTRQRNRAFDLLTLYIATSSPQNLDMVLRANIENYTYVLSYDESYAYVSILTSGGLADSIQTLIIGATENILNDLPFVTVDDTYDNPPGTEIRRLTP